MTENSDYLTRQLITYIGNKRALLPFISQALDFIHRELGKEKLDCLDLFSGSGVVSRFMKAHASSVTANDMELYAKIISECYLFPPSENDKNRLLELHDILCKKVNAAMHDFEFGGNAESAGFISELYAPKDSLRILPNERCFYTPRNAAYIDFMRREIDKIIPEELKCFFIAPLLSEASIHANTGGVFKGFYKNSETGVGQFGGKNRDALSRICGNIELPFPIFSSFQTKSKVFCMDANELVQSPALYENLNSGAFDAVYIDPPYNQHPYGSNYFMLNLIASYKRPDLNQISKISGIPHKWNHSAYNKKDSSACLFEKLIAEVRTKFVIVSFNSDGFITRSQMEEILSRYGKLKIFECKYNTFRASRNLHKRSIYVKEYLYVLRKNPAEK